MSSTPTVHDSDDQHGHADFEGTDGSGDIPEGKGSSPPSVGGGPQGQTGGRARPSSGRKNPDETDVVKDPTGLASRVQSLALGPANAGHGGVDNTPGGASRPIPAVQAVVAVSTGNQGSAPKGAKGADAAPVPNRPQLPRSAQAQRANGIDEKAFQYRFDDDFNPTSPRPLDVDSLVSHVFDPAVPPPNSCPLCPLGMHYEDCKKAWALFNNHGTCSGCKDPTCGCMTVFMPKGVIASADIPQSEMPKYYDKQNFGNEYIALSLRGAVEIDRFLESQEEVKFGAPLRTEEVDGQVVLTARGTIRCKYCAKRKVGCYQPHGPTCNLHVPANVGVISEQAFKYRDPEFANPMMFHCSFFQAQEGDDTTNYIMTSKGKAVPKDRGSVHWLRAVISLDGDSWIHLSVCTCGIRGAKRLSFVELDITQLKNWRLPSPLYPSRGINPMAPLLLPQFMMLDQISTCPLPGPTYDEWGVIFKTTFKRRIVDNPVETKVYGVITDDGIPFVFGFSKTDNMPHFGRPEWPDTLWWPMDGQVPTSYALYYAQPHASSTIGHAVSKTVPGLIDASTPHPICVDFLKGSCTRACRLKHQLPSGACPFGKMADCLHMAKSNDRERHCPRVHSDEKINVPRAAAATVVTVPVSLVPATAVQNTLGGTSGAPIKPIPAVAKNAKRAINADIKANPDEDQPNDRIEVVARSSACPRKDGEMVVPFQLDHKQVTILASVLPYVPISGSTIVPNPIQATLQWHLINNFKSMLALPRNVYLYGASPEWSQLGHDMFCPKSTPETASWPDSAYTSRVPLHEVPANYDAGIIVDTYDVDVKGAPRPIDQQTIIAAAQQTNKQTIYWVRRPFDDVFGSHFQGTVFFERDRNNLDRVIETTNERGANCMRHSCPDWIGEGACEVRGGSWCVWTTSVLISDYLVTRFQIVDTPYVHRARHDMSQSPVTSVDVSYWGPAALSPRIQGLMARTPVLQHIKFDAVTPWFAYGNFVLTGPHREIELVAPSTLVSSIQKGVTFKDRSPDKMRNHFVAAATQAERYHIPEKYFVMTIVACMVLAFEQSVELEASTLNAIRGKAAATVNGAFTGKTDPTQVSITSVLAMVATGYYIAQKFNPIGPVVKKHKPASLFSLTKPVWSRGMFVTNVFISPVAEEIVKRKADSIIPGLSLVLPLVEAYGHQMDLPSTIFHCALHSSFTIAPLEVGILMHAAYNAFVHFTNKGAIDFPPESYYNNTPDAFPQNSLVVRPSPDGQNLVYDVSGQNQGPPQSATDLTPASIFATPPVMLAVAGVLASVAACATMAIVKPDLRRGIIGRISEYVYGTRQHPTLFRRFASWVGSWLPPTPTEGVIDDDEWVSNYAQYQSYAEDRTFAAGVSTELHLPVSRLSPDGKLPLDPHSALFCDPSQLIVEEVHGTPTFVAEGVVVGRCAPSTPAVNATDVYNGLAKRHLCLKDPVVYHEGQPLVMSPQEMYEVLDMNAREIYQALVRHLQSAQTPLVQPIPMSFGEFLKHCRPNVARRISRSLQDHFWGEELVPRELASECFGKKEVQVQPKILRLIQTRSDKYMATVGPYYVPMVKLLASVWRPFLVDDFPNRVFYFSGCDGADLGKWTLEVSNYLFTIYSEWYQKKRVPEIKTELKFLDDAVSNMNTDDAMADLLALPEFYDFEGDAKEAMSKAHDLILKLKNEMKDGMPKPSDFVAATLGITTPHAWMDVVACDCSSYDGHNRPEAITAAMLALGTRFGIPDHIIRCTLNSLVISGTVSAGEARVAFRTFGTTITGDHTTSTLNTATNVGKYLAILRSPTTPSHIRDNTFIVVVGDDALLLGPPGLKDVDFKSGFARFGDSLVQNNSQLFASDFCQMRPWPAEDGSAIIWGPKPFRRLTKLPWSVRVQGGQANALDLVMMGTFNDVHHVPLLHEVYTLNDAKIPEGPPLYSHFFKKPLDRPYKPCSLGYLMFERLYGVSTNSLTAYIKAWQRYFGSNRGFVRIIEDDAFRIGWLVDVGPPSTSTVYVVDPDEWNAIRPRSYVSIAQFMAEHIRDSEDEDKALDQLYLDNMFIAEFAPDVRSLPPVIQDAIEHNNNVYQEVENAPIVTEAIAERYKNKRGKRLKKFYLSDEALRPTFWLREKGSLCYRFIKATLVRLRESMPVRLHYASILAGLQTRQSRTIIQPHSIIPTPTPTHHSNTKPNKNKDVPTTPATTGRRKRPFVRRMPGRKLKKPSRLVGKTMSVRQGKRGFRPAALRVPIRRRPAKADGPARAIMSATGRAIAEESKVINVVARKPLQRERRTINRRRLAATGPDDFARKFSAMQDEMLFRAYAWARGFYHPDFPATRFPDRNPYPTMLSNTHQWRPSASWVTQTTSLTQYLIVAFSYQLSGTFNVVTGIDAAGTLTWGSATNHPFLALFTGDLDKYRYAKFITRLIDTSAFTARGGSLLKAQFMDEKNGSTLPTTLSDLYTAPGTTMCDLADANIGEKSSAAPIFIDEAANDMTYLASASASQPVIVYSLKLPAGAAVQDITFMLTSAIEAVPFANTAMRYANLSWAGDPNMVAHVIRMFSDRLTFDEMGNPSDWTWRGLAESIVSWGKKLWGPVKAVANALAPYSPIAATIATGMNSLSGKGMARHLAAVARVHTRMEAYEEAVAKYCKSEGKLPVPPHPSNPFGPYYAGLVGSPLNPGALRQARAAWLERTGAATERAHPDVLLHEELSEIVSKHNELHDIPDKRLPLGHYYDDVCIEGSTFVLTVDSPEQPYTVILKCDPKYGNTDDVYFSVPEAGEEEAKQAPLSQPNSATNGGSTRARSATRS